MFGKQDTWWATQKPGRGTERNLDRHSPIPPHPPCPVYTGRQLSVLAALFLEWFLHLNSFYVVVREGGQVQVFFPSLLGLDGFLAQNNLPVTMAPLRQPALGSCPWYCVVVWNRLGVCLGAPVVTAVSRQPLCAW